MTKLLKLTPQARRLYVYMTRTGSISAREALLDLDITSATLSRRICDLEEQGYRITREHKKHPMTGKRYTRYALTEEALI
jgi:DNA-binding MarR family transcriptional regulator